MKDTVRNYTRTEIVASYEYAIKAFEDQIGVLQGEIVQLQFSIQTLAAHRDNLLQPLIPNADT